MNFVLCQGREGPEEPLEGLGGRTAAEDQVRDDGFGFSRTPGAILGSPVCHFITVCGLLMGKVTIKE